jgi:hypothetical protein
MLTSLLEILMNLFCHFGEVYEPKQDQGTQTPTTLYKHPNTLNRQYLTHFLGFSTFSEKCNFSLKFVSHVIKHISVILAMRKTVLFTIFHFLMILCVLRATKL